MEKFNVDGKKRETFLQVLVEGVPKKYFYNIKSIIIQSNYASPSVAASNCVAREFAALYHIKMSPPKIAAR